MQPLGKLGLSYIKYALLSTRPMAMAAASHSFKLLTLNIPKDSQDREDILAYSAKSMIINMNQEYTTLNT